MALQHLRSNTASKRPTAGAMSDGQIAVNTNATSPGLFFKDAGGAIIKVGPVHVGTTAPNSSPAGSTGNSLGEQWLDTSGGGYVLKIWDGSAWRSEVGEFVDAAGDTMTGALILPNGTAAAPALGVGSTDNGVYSPGADQVAISTNGTGRLFVDAGGNVGVGTANPAVSLDISSATGVYLRTGGASVALELGPQAGSTGPGIEYNVDGTTWIRGRTDAYPLAFKTNNQERLRITSTGQIQSGGLGSAASPALSFSSDTNTGIYSPGADQLALSTNGTGRLFVDADGNVGVHKANPLATLDVEAVVDQYVLRLRNNGGNSTKLLFANALAGLGEIWYQGDFRFVDDENADIERLRIDSSGRVGIGTSGPSNTLDVSGTLRSTGIARLGTGQTTALAYIGNPDAVGNKYIVFGRASSLTDIVNIQGVDAGVGAADISLQATGGRVGIGTTSPNRQLQVENASGNAVAAIVSGTGSSSFLLLGDTADDNIGQIGYSNVDNALLFDTNGSERARIDSSGRLLVGTSSARNNLSFASVTPSIQLAGNSTSSSSVLLHKYGNDANPCKLILLKNRGANASSNGGLSANDPLGVISFEATDGYGGSTLIGAEIGAYAETGHNTANDDGPSRLVFSTTADGASSPTERMRIAQDGRSSLFGSGNIVINLVTDAAANNATDWLIVGRYSGTSTTTGTTSFQVYSNGDVANTNNVYGAISDIKLKENIVDASSQWNDIKALQVRNYNFKEGQTHTQIGLVAQEVELVSPGLVSESPDRDEDGNDLGTVTKSVNYSVLYMKAVKALQEAMERIETLEAKVAALEAS